MLLKHTGRRPSPSFPAFFPSSISLLSWHVKVFLPELPLLQVRLPRIHFSSSRPVLVLIAVFLCLLDWSVPISLTTHGFVARRPFQTG